MFFDNSIYDIILLNIFEDITYCINIVMDNVSTVFFFFFLNKKHTINMSYEDIKLIEVNEYIITIKCNNAFCWDYYGALGFTIMVCCYSRFDKCYFVTIYNHLLYAL